MKQKIYLPFFLLHFILMALSTQVGSEDSLSEFKAAVEKYNESRIHWDMEELTNIEAESIGLSDFHSHVQNHKTIAPELRCKILKRVLSQYEYYEINIVTLQTEVIDNTGIASGNFVVTRKHKEFPEVSARKRWSSTWVKRDGQWKLIFYHRELIDSHW